MRILITLFLIVSFSFATNINIKSNQWNFVGTTDDINISTLNLDSGDIVWNYSDNNWSCFLQDGDCGYTTISSLDSGDAFWIKRSNDKNISIGDGTAEKSLSNGWNMITAVTDDINMTQYAGDNNISFAFTYDNGVWRSYSKSGVMEQLGYNTIDTISKAQGAWVYKYAGTFINVGNDQTLLSQGDFQTVTKSTTDDIEDIWNITLLIDTSKNYDDFHIGVKFYKREDDGSDDIGEFVYKNVLLNNNVLAKPELLAINGIGDSSSGSTYFDAGYDPNNIRANSIVLNGNKLTLKLGLVMKSQTMVSESRFKVAEDYDIIITSTKPIINNSKIVNVKIINSDKYNFANTNGIEGRIEIK